MSASASKSGHCAIPANRPARLLGALIRSGGLCAALTVLAVTVVPLPLDGAAGTSEIYQVDGSAFGYDIEPPPLGLRVIEGSVSVERAGKLLGRAATPQAVLEGPKGSFIEEGGTVLFSSPQGADPRKERESYHVRASLRPAPLLVFVALSVITLSLARRLSAGSRAVQPSKRAGARYLGPNRAVFLPF